MENNSISDADKELFKKSVGEVRKISQDTVFSRKTVQAPARPESPSRNSPKAVSEKTGDGDTGHFLAGDFLSFKKPGIQNRVLSKLRRGQFAMEGFLDLHGMTTNEAYRALEYFLGESVTQKRQHVLIIHGKGRGSGTGKPIIKNRVFGWLRQYPDVLAFCSARQNDGGTGALYVMLRKQ
ncbi:MAG: Smr/MutS family protein [Gammaproteobacteria bacterium]|nr:DNA mismatch repair protein MutS [Gammaproteobacteria bacterium]NIN61397.1 DNA mismatch repair protein MutS [Gammaproteobacteria bacterium]NIO61164.1 DNA mismatch repair protein MutS [Gammaproteobacteria bacterium]NIP48902.1 Smr/MutS family protein [Gammaproteobacteria bacterium]NIQ09356.1 Smr/MutS family protein [Gammaproteobacteria bacterium]